MYVRTYVIFNPLPRTSVTFSLTQALAFLSLSMSFISPLGQLIMIEMLDHIKASRTPGLLVKNFTFSTPFAISISTTAEGRSIWEVRLPQATPRPEAIFAVKRSSIKYAHIKNVPLVMALIR